MKYCWPQIIQNMKSENKIIALTKLLRLYFVDLGIFSSLQGVVLRLVQYVPNLRSIHWPLIIHPNNRQCIGIDQLAIDQILRCIRQLNQVLVVQRMQPNKI